MSVQKVKNPFTTFIDRDGKPLENGKIYIGVYGENPITYPQNVYWDDATTSAAVQPIRTLNGYPVNNGTAAKIFVADRYSIAVYNKNDELIYSSLNTDENLVTGAIVGLISNLIGYAPTINKTRVIVTGYYSDGDEGGGIFFWDETVDKSTANAGTIVDPSVSLANQGTGVGLGCWVRQYTGAIHTSWFDTIQHAFNTGGDIIVDEGEHLHDGLSLNVANTRVIILKGATLKLNNGANATSILLNANNCTVEGDGIVDGNEANQIFAVDTVHGVDFAISITNPKVTGITIQNTIGCGIRGRQNVGGSVYDVKIINAKYIPFFFGTSTATASNIKFNNIEVFITDTRHNYVGFKVDANESFYASGIDIGTVTVKRTLETGTATATAATLTDSTATWEVGEWIGFMLYNATDQSYGLVTANTATTITATLAEGTLNTWTTGDTYSLAAPNAVGVETKRCLNVNIGKIIGENNYIGMSLAEDTNNASVGEIVLTTEGYCNIGLEISGSQNITAGVLSFGGTGIYKSAIQPNTNASTTTLLSKNVVVGALNCTLCEYGLNIVGLSLTDIIDDIKIGLINIKSRKYGVWAKYATNITGDNLTLDCGDIPIRLENSTSFSFSNIHAKNTVNATAHNQVVLIQANEPTLVVDNVLINGLNYPDTWAAAYGSQAIYQTLSGGATLGANIMSKNNTEGWEIISSATASTTLWNATVNLTKVSVLPSTVGALTNVADGSMVTVSGNATAANNGLYIKESGTWTKK